MTGCKVGLAVLLALAGCRQLLGLDEPAPMHGDASGNGGGSDSSTSTPRDGHTSDGAGSCDQTACALAAGTCAGGVCTITGTGSPVTCPPGMPCTITCGNCGGATIDCSMATKCTIDCTWPDGCSSRTIKCSHDCTLYCTGSTSCGQDVIAGGGTGCAVECCGTGSCSGLNAPGCMVDIPGTCP